MRRIVLVAASGLGVLVLLLLAVGWRPVVLLSDSMAPGAPAGSLLVTRPVDPGEVEPGDVLTVPLPAGEGRVTHRVVDIEVEGDARWAQLKGDSNATPDAGRVRLEGPTLRTVAVVPAVGRVVGGGNPVLVAGIVLLLIGTLGLAFVERRSSREAADWQGRHDPRLPTGTSGLDTRALALFATLEALAEDGLDLETLEALARARLGALLGLGAVEDSDAVEALDDGARFVVIGLADADPDALALVPPGSRRAVDARDAITEWWRGIEHRIPAAVRAELHDVMVAAADPLDELPDVDDLDEDVDAVVVLRDLDESAVDLDDGLATDLTAEQGGIDRDRPVD